jgi:outer membrane protein assembly factor BamB
VLSLLAGAAAGTMSSACVGAGLGPSRVPLARDQFLAPAGVLRVRWSRKLVGDVAFFSYKPQEFAAAAMSDDGQLVYIGSSEKKMFAFRVQNGEVAWERTLGSAVSSRPLFLKAGTVGPEALLIFGDDGGVVNALEARTGQQRWSYRGHGPVQTQPVLSGSLLYVASNEGRLYALDVRTGSWRWSYERETQDAFSIRGTSAALPVPSTGRLYAGFPDGYLSCLNSENGEVIWNRQLCGDATRFTDVDGTPTLLGDTLVVSCYATGVFGLEPKDGSTRWRFDLETAGSFVVDFQRERIYVVSATQGLFCLDKHGRKLWQQVMSEQGELSAPTLWRRYLMFSAAISGLHIIEAENGQLLQCFDPGQGASAQPVAQGNDAYLLSNAGAFFAFTTDKESA